MFKQISLTILMLGLLITDVSATKTEVDFTATAVTENVYSIIAPSYGRPSFENKGWNSNSHFVVTEKGVLVFDTGSSQLIGKKMLRVIKSVTNQPVRWVVNSHSHADHWLGNAAFSEVGAEVIATDAAVAKMKKDGQQDVAAFSRMTEGATGNSKLSYPVSMLSQKQKRILGGVEVEFIYSNSGHSPGDILMWLPKQKIIFGGDVLSSDWLPIMTPHGNVPNLIEALNAVIDLKPLVVLTGHGEITTVKSVIRDADFLTAAWTLVKSGRQNDKDLDSILVQVNSQLGETYRPLYKDFDTSIKYLVQMMYKKHK